MGYNYELNIRVPIPYEVYRRIVTAVLAMHEDEWGQKADPDRERQYIWFFHIGTQFYLHSYEVTRNISVNSRELITKDQAFLSVNSTPLKWCENTSIFTIQEDVARAKGRIEDLLMEYDYTRHYGLGSLEIYYATQESPYQQ